MTTKRVSGCILLAAGFLFFCVVLSVPSEAQTAGPCAETVAKYCKDVTPGGGRIMKCLNDHRDDQSMACRDWLEDQNKSLKELNTSCTEEIAGGAASMRPTASASIDAWRIIIWPSRATAARSCGDQGPDAVKGLARAALPVRRAALVFSTAVRMRFTTTQSAILAGALLMTIAGCATLPKDYPREFSRAWELPQETKLGRAIAPAAGQHTGKSGFHLLGSGMDAFVARMALAEAAERTLDLQYYIFHVDLTESCSLTAWSRQRTGVFGSASSSMIRPPKAKTPASPYLRPIHASRCGCSIPPLGDRRRPGS